MMRESGVPLDVAEGPDFPNRRQNMHGALRASVNGLWETVRPEQWYKNLVVFVGLVFSGSLSNQYALQPALLAFFAFCAASSATYIFNDLIDIERDKLHPRKAARPLSSGQLDIALATGTGVMLLVAAIALSTMVNPLFLQIVAAFLGVQISYQFGLKHVAPADVVTVAVGFVLRAVGGAVALLVDVSPWLIVCTFLLATLLAFAKRARELELLADMASTHRPSLRLMPRGFVRDAITATVAALLVSYAIYTFYGPYPLMIMTVPFAVFGVLRYLLLIYQRPALEEPGVVVSDTPSLVNACLWVLTVTFVIYIA